MPAPWRGLFSPRVDNDPRMTRRLESRRHNTPHQPFLAPSPIPCLTCGPQVMADPVLNVFLSAVTKELGSYRAVVAKALREKGLHVKIQEEGQEMPSTSLSSLYQTSATP